jgi:hypothetical protein
MGIAAAGLASFATLMLRGCWHRRMGWPIRYDNEFSYQVCTDCGIKRLYDDRAFRAYGPHGYDVEKLIARQRVAYQKHMERVRADKAAKKERSARSAS